MFVKPAHLGSSVGIVKVTDPERLGEALEGAYAHDARVIVEATAPGVEVECAVLGSLAAERVAGAGAALASTPGEISFEGDFYDFDAKYLPGGMELTVPARISEQASERVRALALEAFARRVRRPGEGRLLRRRRACAGERAEHDAGLHADERVREVDGGFGGRLSGGRRSVVQAGVGAACHVGGAGVLGSDMGSGLDGLWWS